MTNITPDTDIASLTDDECNDLTPGQILAMTPDQHDAFGERLSAMVMQRLLKSPMLTIEQVKASGVDPETANLLRLQDGENTVFPAFQFGPDGTPYVVVLAVNEVFRADELDDHPAVLDWWLSPHAWLRDGETHATPASQITVMSDERLIEFANADVSDD